MTRAAGVTSGSSRPVGGQPAAIAGSVLAPAAGPQVGRRAGIEQQVACRLAARAVQPLGGTAARPPLPSPRASCRRHQRRRRRRARLLDLRARRPGPWCRPGDQAQGGIVVAGGGGAFQAGIVAERGRDRAVAEQGPDHLDAVRVLAQVDEADQVAELVRGQPHAELARRGSG